MRAKRHVWFYYYPHISVHTLSSHNSRIPYAHCLAHNLTRLTERFTFVILQHKAIFLLVMGGIHSAVSLRCTKYSHSHGVAMGQPLNLKLSVNGVQAVI